MWTNESVAQLVTDKGYQTELAGDVLVISNEDDLQITLIIQDDQILSESIIAPASEITDLAVFNNEILHVHHKLFPLAGIAINQLNGSDYYVAFGAISSECTDTTLLIEIETLFDNVIDMLDVFKPHFKMA